MPCSNLHKIMRSIYEMSHTTCIAILNMHTNKSFNLLPIQFLEWKVSDKHGYTQHMQIKMYLFRNSNYKRKKGWYIGTWQYLVTTSWILLNVHMEIRSPNGMKRPGIDFQQRQWWWCDDEHTRHSLKCTQKNLLGAVHKKMQIFFPSHYMVSFSFTRFLPPAIFRQQNGIFLFSLISLRIGYVRLCSLCYICYWFLLYNWKKKRTHS